MYPHLLEVDAWLEFKDTEDFLEDLMTRYNRDLMEDYKKNAIHADPTARSRLRQQYLTSILARLTLKPADIQSEHLKLSRILGYSFGSSSSLGATTPRSILAASAYLRSLLVPLEPKHRLRGSITDDSRKIRWCPTP